MKKAAFFLIPILLPILIGACCHSPAPVSQAPCHHHMPFGFEYVGYNPGYVYPSLFDFAEMPYFPDYMRARHHDCDMPEGAER